MYVNLCCYWLYTLSLFLTSLTVFRISPFPDLLSLLPLFPFFFFTFCRKNDNTPSSPQRKSGSNVLTLDGSNQDNFEELMAKFEQGSNTFDPVRVNRSTLSAMPSSEVRENDDVCLYLSHVALSILRMNVCKQLNMDTQTNS